MLGARSIARAAVGSRANVNTSRTRITNITAETIAVRERNSITRSFDATAQACRPTSGNRIAVLLTHLLRPAAGARGEVDEPSGAHEGDVGRQSGAFFDI